MELKEKIVIGLMSGTSLDGVDAVITKIQPDFSFELIERLFYPYNSEVKKRILNLASNKANVSDVCRMNFYLAELFSEVCLNLIKKAGLINKKIDFIASHGQTVWHEGTSTLQIGDGSVIAQKTGIPTIFNFRTADIATGGQGAPLVPFADKMIFSSKEISRCIQNIGGMGNVTVVSPYCETFAFDTGAGNVLIDIAMREFFNKEYDKDGLESSKGRVSERLLEYLMKEPFLAQNPPKTTGRELFNVNYLKKALDFELPKNPNDIISTLTAFTAKSIVKAYKDFVLPKTSIDEIILGGGGAYNKCIISFLNKFFKEEFSQPPKILTHNDFGIPNDFKEAIAFAILGYASFYKIPNNIPSATGAKKAVILGQIASV